MYGKMGRVVGLRERVFRMADQIRVTYRDLLRDRNFTALWLGQTVSLLGDTFNLTSLWFLMMSKVSKGSPATPLMTMLMINTAAYILVSPFAGVFADRWNRKKTMIAMDLARALLVLTIPLARSLAQLYLISLLVTVASIFFRPCLQASVPRILPKEQLMLGNSAMSTGRGLANSMGFFAGGVLIAAFGYDIAFYIDSASFLISAVMIAIIALPHLPAATGKSLRENVAVVLNNMRDGWAYVSRHRAARVLFATVFILFLCGGAYNMMEAAFVGKTLGGGTGGFGLVSGVMTLSFLIGTILFGGMAHRLNPFNTFSWGALGMGLSVLAFASSPNLAVAVGLAALFGLVNPFYFIASEVILQSTVENQILGRVYSLFTLSNQVATFLSAVYVGFAQETLHFSVRLTLQSMGLIAVAGGFLALWLYWRERQGAAKEEVPAAGV